MIGVTPQPTAKPMRADARRNRAKVLESAEAVFAARGTAASMDDIARAAGVGIGTLYRHFPTKEALFEAIVRARTERLLARAEELADAEDPGAAFYGFFTTVVEQAEAKKAFADALAGVGVDVRDALSDVAARIRAAIGVLLARAQRADAVRQDVTAAQVLALLAGASLAADRFTWDAPTRTGALAVLFDGLRAGTG